MVVPAYRPGRNNNQTYTPPMPQGTPVPAPVPPIQATAVNRDIERSPFAPGSASNPIIGTAVDRSIESYNFGVPKPQNDLLNQTLKGITGPITHGVPAPTPGTKRMNAQGEAAPVPPPSAPSAPPSPGYFVPPPPGSAPQVPTATPQMPVRDRDAIAKYVDGQIAAKLARSRSEADQTLNAGRTTAQQQLGALGTQFNRLKTTIGEDRSVQNVENARRLSPFSGRSDYALGMIEQNRARSDREMNENFQTQQANVTADLANLENSINAKYAALQETQGAERERLQREIEADERQYELAMRGEARSDVLANSQLTNAEFQKELQAFQTNRGVFESDRGFGYQQSRDGVADNQWGQQFGFQKDQFGEQQKQNNLSNYWKGIDAYGYSDGPVSSGQALGDMYKGQPSLQGRQVASQEAQRQWDNTFKEGQFDFTKAQQLWENTFKEKSFQQDVSQFAQSLGADYSRMNMQQQQFVAEMAFKNKAQTLDQAKFDYAKENDATKAPTAEDYAKYIDGTPGLTTKDEYTGAVTVNKEAAERMILASGLPESEMIKLYQRYGIPMGG